MSDDTRSQILDLGARWVEAETRGDTTTLDEIATADFRLVGPFGFVLDKPQWLDRYRSGDFATGSLVWDDVEIREHGDTAIAIGQHTQQATYQGRPADGRFRTTHVYVRAAGRWMLASLHLSQAAPPVPRPEGKDSR